MYNKIFKEDTEPLKEIADEIIKLEECLRKQHLLSMSSSNRSEPPGWSGRMHKYYNRLGWQRICDMVQDTNILLPLVYRHSTWSKLHAIQQNKKTDTRMTKLKGDNNAMANKQLYLLSNMVVMFFGAGFITPLCRTLHLVAPSDISWRSLPSSHIGCLRPSTAYPGSLSWSTG